MMHSEAIWAAAITAIATVICQIIIANKSRAVMEYRIDQLEEKVMKHNNLVERTYKLEQKVADMEK